jgi:hypothetical protein
MTDVAKLYELQKTDSNWEKVKRRLLQLQKLLGENDELRSARQNAAESKATLHHWQTQQVNAELESESLHSKIVSSEQRLMSGQVRNPKELQSLQESIDALKRQRLAVDGGGIEAMGKVEQLHLEVAQRQKRMAEIEAAWRQRHAEFVEEENKLKRTFLQLKTHRTKLLATLTDSEVEHYEDLRKRKAGVAVAVIDKGMCASCNMRLPTGTVSAARNPAQTTLCPSCGRILFHL